MDNICHTLVGAALAQTGLKRRTGLATATLMIGANFPDIDVLSIPFGRATEFRRGWTHGVLALVVLPFVLTAIMLAWDWYRRRSLATERAPVIPRELLLLSAVSILTHPTLDWMNSYGLRWLMPFNGRWFYGDSLFIVDPWLLLVLGLGVWLSRRYERRSNPHPWRPARIALAVAGAYIVSMLGLHAAAEQVALRELAENGNAMRRLIVTPMPADPVHWSVYADDGAQYSRYLVSLTPGNTRRLSVWQPPIETHASDPAAAEAARTEKARRFLNWARLPYYHVAKDVKGTSVEIIDARYGASVTVRVNTMTDPRDSQLYPTMGTAGQTWLARNLDFVTTDSWCYGDAKDCAMYGRVYTRNAALKACPPGWRLPSVSDWIDLAKGFGGYYEFVSRDTVGDPRASYMALTTGSFGAKLGGSRDPAGKYMDLEGDGMYWTSSTCGRDSVSFIVFNEHSRRVMLDCGRDEGWAQSVRCLRVR